MNDMITPVLSIQQRINIHKALYRNLLLERPKMLAQIVKHPRAEAVLDQSDRIQAGVREHLKRLGVTEDEIRAIEVSTEASTT